MLNLARSSFPALLVIAALLPASALAQDDDAEFAPDELSPPSTSAAAPPFQRPGGAAAPTFEEAPAARAGRDAPGFSSDRRPERPYTFVADRRRERVVIGYRDSRRNPPLIWGTGLGLFLAGYVLDFAILTPIANAISNDRDGADEEDAWAWALIPIAGPVIQLGVGAPHPAIPIATGLMQIGGLVTFILGLVNEETTSIPVYQGSEHDPNMLRIGLDAAQVDGGAQLRMTLTHL